MRNCITSVKYLCIFSAGILFFMSGCTTPKHSNTLIFGTNTKFALDVSADPTGSPSVTVGYKRQEAVWMPLIANEDAKGKPAKCPDDKCLYIGKEDKSGQQEDTYSVLASFGAKFSGGATGTGGAKAEGGLAQYFATGLAARKLAEVGGARLVSVQPADSEILNEFKKKGIYAAKTRISKKIDILATVAPNDTLDKTKWESLIDEANLPDSTKNKLKELKNFNEVNQQLDMDAAMNGTVINALHSNL